jgi:hypothetical protein
MANYERRTALPVETVLRMAEEVMTERLPLERVKADPHSVTLAGADGMMTVSAHRHGPDTIVVVMTDQLRTSRLDNEAQYLLSRYPYQPGDRATR